MKPLFPIEGDYKIDQRFKDPTSYGPHEGIDVNLKSGGNTDCGTLYRAVADGEIIHASESTANYGRLIVLKCKTVLGERYVRYAHCDEIPARKALVKRGDTIATMGSTGNSTACHLHFDVLKKVPSNWRYYGKTNFDEYFEDPEVFFTTELEPTLPATPALEFTEQTKIPLNIITEKETYTTIELGTLKSKIKDKDRNIYNLENETTTLRTSISVSDKNFAELGREFDNQKGRILALEQENETLRAEVENLKVGILPKPFFKLGNFTVYLSR